MKNIFAIIMAVLAISIHSCIEDDFTTSPNDVLEFSTDTLSFDTVFTGEATATKRFLVYNRHKKQLNIEHISIEGSAQGARFYMNVDGRSGESFSNIEVRGEDSIYIFVEAKVETNSQDLPFDIFDKLNFVTNGVQQTITLHAAGQNVNTIKDLHITENTVLDDAKPYRVMDSIVVEEGATLTIPAGKTIYFHDKAQMKVRGTLIARGEQGKTITFRADRLDKVAGSIPFDLMSGQWGGITFGEKSFENELAYVYLNGSSFGITADSCGVLDKRKLYLFNSIIHNSASTNLKAAYSWIDADGCEFSDSRDGVVDLTGGQYAFNNCTFANYYLFDAIMSPILTLSGVMADEMTGKKPLMSANFNNCIIYGNAADITHGDLTGSKVKLRNCLLQANGEDDANFINCIWGGDPLFYTVREDYIFDYRLKNESDAIGAGDKSLCPDYMRYDYYGNDRFASGKLDLGAYVWIEQKEEEEK